jgi:succinoglycan biosynthesis transport protein ExoP
VKGLHFSGPQDYLALLVRRKWWVLFPFVALSAASMLFAYILPRMYVSETLILIRPRDVPEDFVKDLLAGTTDQRLTAIQQTVLSRTNLVQILNEFEDQLAEYKNLNMDDRVVRLNRQIGIKFEAEKRGNVQLPVTYFRISYQNRNPALAQKIAAKLSALFIEQDNRTRENQVFGTTQFLSGELAKVEDELQRSAVQLRNLKAQKRYELPEQLETNLRTLDRLNLQKQANAEAVDRYATIRLNLERMISETDPVIPRQAQRGAAPARTSALEDYRQKKIELDQLSAKYTAKHPEVEAAAVQLERLRKALSSEDLAAAEKPVKEDTPETLTMPNPVYQNLVSQLEQVKTEFEIREKERKVIETEIARFSLRVQRTPESEQELADVLRQNQDLMKQYDELKSHVAQAKLSESLESRQRGSQFVVIDPANYPLTPTKPSKPLIAFGGLALSLAIGIALALVTDVANQKIWTHSEIEHLLGGAVLAEIPEILTDADLVHARKKKTIFVASSIAAAAAYSVCLYMVYAHQGFILRQIDPLLQRLYS